MSASFRPNRLSLRFRCTRRQPTPERVADHTGAGGPTTTLAATNPSPLPDLLIRLRDLERQLAEMTARMKVIMDHVPAGIVLLKPIAGDSPNFLITAVNKNINTVAGFTKQFLYEGGRLAECLRPAVVQGMYGQCEIDKRIAERMAWYASRPDETIWSVFPTVGNRFVKATRSPLGDFGFVVVTVDTTEQVKAERALANKSGQFDLMLDNMPEGVVLFAPDQTVVAHSRRVNAMLGVSNHCVRVDRSLETCVRALAEAGMYETPVLGDIDAMVQQRMDWYTSEPEKTISAVQAVADGRVLKFTRSPVDEYGTVVLFVDITEQINKEEELKAARDRAEAALEDLLVAQNRLVQAEKLASLGRMVAGVAHEINTPLGIAVTMASLISGRVRELEADLDAGRLRRSDMKRYIAETCEGCDLMLTNLRRGADLVHSFKQVATDQASDDRRRFDLGRLINDTIVSLSPVWRKAGHRIDVICPEPIALNGQPGVISQILTNLLTNSIIHGFEPGRTGILTIVTTQKHNNTIELCYTDNGKGISRETRDKVFDPFFTTRRSSGSTGLGLHIIYNLVVGKLGGTIDLETDTGQGVHFVLRFPRTLDPERPRGQM